MDSGHRFHELADNAPVLIWRAGADRRFNYVNLRRLEFTGRTLQEELGEGWFSAIHPEDLARCRTAFERAFELRQEFTMDYRLRRRDGAYRWMVDNGRAFYLSDGTFGGFLGSSIDITDRKEAEVRAAEALADARRAIRQRDVLLAEVHHRVKNNLQVILSLIGLKTRQAGDESCRRALESVSRRVQAIGVIQQELHDDSDVSRIDMLDFVRRLVRPIGAIHLRDQVSTTVTGDRVAIDLPMASIVGLILSEVLANAYEHAFPQGQGTVTVEVNGGSAETPPSFSIRDNGPGFSAADGHGIGILLIRNLARQGNLEIRTEWGAGGHWTFLLPREQVTSET